MEAPCVSNLSLLIPSYYSNDKPADFMALAGPPRMAPLQPSKAGCRCTDNGVTPVPPHVSPPQDAPIVPLFVTGYASQSGRDLL
jgi:hypothetical protein